MEKKNNKIKRKKKITAVEKTLVTTINELTTGARATVGSTNHDLGWP